MTIKYQDDNQTSKHVRAHLVQRQGAMGQACFNFEERGGTSDEYMNRGPWAQS